MGRQINFFMMPEDVAELDEQAKKLGFVIIEGANKDNKFIPIDSSSSSETLLYFILEEDIPNIITNFLLTKKTYVINPMRSPVIEFSKSYFSENKITEGRLFYNKQLLNADDEFFFPSENFLNTADKLIKATRKYVVPIKIFNSLMSKTVSDWLSDEANYLQTLSGKHIQKSVENVR